MVCSRRILRIALYRCRIIIQGLSDLFYSSIILLGCFTSFITGQQDFPNTILWRTLPDALLLHLHILTDSIIFLRIFGKVTIS